MYNFQVYDPMKISNKKMDEIKNKVRVLIYNSKDEILVVNYSGIYMLPGGKLEDYEQPIGKSLKKALRREITEEIGINITNKQLDKLTAIYYYQENYPKVNGEVINRLVITDYYKTKMDIDLNTVKNNLSEREKSGNFKLEWIKKDKLRDVLINSTSTNPRKDFFHNELRLVLEKELRTIDIDLIEKNRKNNHPKYIDMHTHSIYSDGELEPDELIKYAYEKDLSVISITDHDNILAYNDLKDNEYIKKGLIKLISGIELSAKVPKGRMHILGYDFNLDDEELNKKMTELRNNSFYSIIAILNELKINFGIVIDSHDITDIFNRKGHIGRPDLAKILIKYNIVETVNEAFDKYLTPAHDNVRSHTKGLPYDECIKLIKDAGGITVLAHPNQLKMDDIELEETLNDLIRCGLDGIEVYHSSHTKEEENKYLALAEKYNLLISGGSDFHGKNIKPNVKLSETSSGKIKKLSLLDKINK